MAKTSGSMASAPRMGIMLGRMKVIFKKASVWN
jgi:hypothetical protein